MSGECILVIDDSKEIVKHLTERVLPTFGYRTLFALDGQSGLALIREEEPSLVMLDYNLPEMTGIDVLRQMAQESISTPVVLMTGYGSELSAIEAFRLGAKDYLIKPFTIDEIVETIDRALVETRLLHDKQELAEQLRRVKVEMSRQSQEMDTLFSIGKAITSLLSVEKVLDRVLEAATYLTDAEESVIWLTDGEGMQLRTYGKENGRRESRPFSPESMVDSRIELVMKNGRPLRQSQFSGDGLELKDGQFARAILYVPLKLRGVTMGVLGVSNRATLRSFSRRNEFLLSFLADYAAIALENARVFQAADLALAAGLDELNILIEITRTITSSLDLDEIIHLTLQQVHNSWHIEASSLWLLDESRRHLKVISNVGTPDELLIQLAVPLGEGFVGHVAKTGKWIYTNDVASHPMHYSQIDRLTGFKSRSLLTVPLLSGGKVIGALQLLNKKDGDFDEQDVERAVSIAAAVAIAANNALLYHRAETRQKHLEVMMEHHDSPILITDADNKVMLLNEQARTRLQLTPEVVGKQAAEVLQPSLLAHLLKQPEEAAQQRVVLPDSSVWMPQIAPIPDNGRILILQNMDGLREIERTKEEFLDAISHDMRSPLQSVLDMAAKLPQAGSLNDEQAALLQNIDGAATRMMALVSGLLELARVSTSEQVRRPCDIRHIIEQAVEEHQSVAEEKKVKIEVTADEALPPLQGDPDQLLCAVGHLIDNAIKYSPSEQMVQIHVAVDHQELAVNVRDQGVGVSDNDLPHIFDKFYRGQAEAEAHGIGLGLALVQSIATVHGGSVTALSSESSRGSTFSLRLPVPLSAASGKRA